jgi:hypothetical protein
VVGKLFRVHLFLLLDRLHGHSVSCSYLEKLNLLSSLEAARFGFDGGTLFGEDLDGLVERLPTDAVGLKDVDKRVLTISRGETMQRSMVLYQGSGSIGFLEIDISKGARVSNKLAMTLMSGTWVHFTRYT